MDSLTKINNIGKSNFPKLKKLSELKQSTNYLILEMKIVPTKFGSRIVVHLEDDVKKRKKFAVFLPPRMLKPFKEDEDLLESLHELINGKKLRLKFLGGIYNNVEFVSE